VFLSDKDVRRLTRHLGISREDLVSAYCRKVSFSTAKRVSLKEKANLDCVFWENGGCAVYPARPLQCQSFPFWSSCLASPEEWKEFQDRCPGIGKGRLHSRNEIEQWLRLRIAQGFIES
jgi:hypothetical protein